MRRAAITFSVGAVIALIAWWPIEGAITAIFWPKVFDAKGPDDVAVETLLAEQDYRVDSLIRHSPDIGNALDDRNCSWRFDVATFRAADLKSGALLLNVAIHHERNNLNSQMVYAVARRDLHGLPNVALGALQGCVEGSLLAGACRRFVAQRLVNAMAAQQRAIAFKTNANDADAIRMACAALDGTRWPPPHAK